ncbi:MAG: hypothetical protein ACI4T5_02515 [Prevotella sp.]
MKRRMKTARGLGSKTAENGGRGAGLDDGGRGAGLDDGGRGDGD